MSFSERLAAKADAVLVVAPGWGVLHPPVGISQIKSSLAASGWSAVCLDLNERLHAIATQKIYWDLNYPEHFILPVSFEREILPLMNPHIDAWVDDILFYSPSVVGFSLYMSTVNASFVIAGRLKERCPDCVIVGGGPEARRYRKVMEKKGAAAASLHPGLVRGGVFDVLVEGEGEPSMGEILAAVKARKGLSAIPGAICFRDGRMETAPRRSSWVDLDLLPPPDYGDYALEGYAAASLPLVTSRGCVNRCTFCADSPLWTSYRFQSAGAVIRQALFLRAAYGRDQFEIVDSTFNGDIRRLDRLCDDLIRLDLRVLWSAKACARKEMTPKLLGKMRRAGCVSLAYGVESGSPRVLRDMRKNADLRTISRVIRDTRRAGIGVNCFFMIGYPTETEDDFLMTLDFIRAHASAIDCFDQVTGCHVEDDSYLGTHPQEYGITFHDDGWHSRHSTPEIRKERLLRFRDVARQVHRHYDCEVQY
ncbi:MAG: radical SAM protein [Candidatus Omnitrophica bacterium]|nr:radical SAM protein [Candidatus Omnitrophota bacterium]MDD5573549.1 radical SAM protein [Candidatus Omnitrophota bacterium]